MRRPVKNRNIVKSDLRYDDAKVSKFINYIMQNGKKTIAQKIVYGAFDILKEKTQKEALEIFELALKNAGPTVEVRSKRVGGSNYQIPVEVRESRKFLLWRRFLINTSNVNDIVSSNEHTSSFLHFKKISRI